MVTTWMGDHFCQALRADSCRLPRSQNDVQILYPTSLSDVTINRGPSMYIRMQKRSCTHGKDPVVHLRVRWVMETLKYPVWTVGWIARLCRSWFSPVKATRFSHGRSPSGTIDLWTTTTTTTTKTCQFIRPPSYQPFPNWSDLISIAYDRWACSREPCKWLRWADSLD